MKTKFHTTLDGLLFEAAKAADETAFLGVMDRIKSLNGGAAKYIEGIERERWARAFFPIRRFGHVTSNISELMNWWLDEARRNTPISLFSIYIRKLNDLFERRRTKYLRMAPTDLPKMVAMQFESLLAI